MKAAKEVETIQDEPPVHHRASLVEKFAAKYSIEPMKLMSALKATAFKQRSDSQEITNEQMAALLIVADQYGLNPFTREIYAFPDKGSIVPVVGIDGWIRIMNEHPQMDGLMFVVSHDDSACTCTIYRKDRNHPIVVTERMAEVRRDTQPWKTHPIRMLRHKALIQCARVAFGFAGIYDEDEGQRIIEGEYALEPGEVATPDLNKRLRGEITSEPETSENSRSVREAIKVAVDEHIDSGQVKDQQTESIILTPDEFLASMGKAATI